MLTTIRTSAVYEVVIACGSKGFSPLMVAQYGAIAQLKKLLPVVTLEGWQTSNFRTWLGQFSVKKVQLLQRSTGLLVSAVGLSNFPPFRGLA